jgi:primosomal protein N' (replication factor Y)
MIADVAFDAPLPPFSYRVPDATALAPGQRVAAPLRGATRVGIVVAVRPGDDPRLKAVARVVDPAPCLSAARLEFARWIADESLSSLGSTCLALLPPPPTACPAPAATAHRESTDAPISEVLVGAGREARVVGRLRAASAPALILVADLDAAARWAQRLARIERVVRLDSGVADGERSDAWRALAEGAARLAVGTRSALLAPLEAGSTVVLVDEHDAAHKPPGPPRLHARDIVLERAGRERLAVVMTAATPSCETWHRVDTGRARLEAVARSPWPSVTIADTRGIARREALTPTLARAIRETLAAGRRVFLLVSRLTSALACDECGAILTCAACAIALAYSPAGRTLTCRLCGTAAAPPETCPTCRGRRLQPFGWGAERVEHAVRRRFAKARIARYDPDAIRGRKAETQRAAALEADVVIGTRGALRLFGPGALGLAGIISPDQLLGLPDFRAGERAFALLWAAAERVRADGRLVVQSQNPAHPALAAVAKQDLAAFYGPELRFRAELGYPPFRRLALLTVTAKDAGVLARLTGRLEAALRSIPTLTVYPPTADRRQRSRRIVVKGEAALPRLIGDPVRAVTAEARGSRGIIDVEVDPVEWPF